MRRMPPSATLFASALAFLSWPAKPTQVYQFKLSGLGAAASFDSGEGPVTFNGHVWIAEFHTREKGGVRATAEGVTRFVGAVDTETWGSPVSTWGLAELPAGILELSQRSETAAAEAEADLENSVTGFTLPATVDVSWAPAEGQTPPQSGGRSDFGSAGVRSSSQYQGTFQPATASATISFSGVGEFPPQSWYAEMCPPTSTAITLYK
jgi:hypothetical protein